MASMVMVMKHVSQASRESNRQNNTPYVSRFIVALLTPLLTPKCLVRDDSPCVNIPRIFQVEVSHNRNIYPPLFVERNASGAKWRTITSIILDLLQHNPTTI